MKIATYKNTQIHYRVFGNGNPLVFLHGFLEDSSMWDKLVKPLGKTHQVVLIDLPCHGKSRFKGHVCTMEFMAHAVKTVLAFENIKQPKVFGHSMGGYVGLELLKLMPIDLILVHSNFWADHIEKQKDRDRVIEVVKDKKEFFIQEAIPNLFYKANISKCRADINVLIEKANQIPKNEICAATLGMKNRLNNTHLLETNTVQIIHGEHDPIITTQQIKSGLNQIKSPIQIHTITDCGHMSIWEKPTELFKIIKQISN